MDTVKVDLEKLSRSLHYPFQKPAYLKQALTHCSVGVENYERFEFLGDSILSFVIAEELFKRLPSQSEGQLSRLRSFLVRGETLTEIAKELNLGLYLFLGQGELKSGGFRRASILADALEAIFAAVYLDGGFVAAKKVILHLFCSRLEDPYLNQCVKDAKTQLQEYLQADKQNLPEYALTKVEGDEHNQLFYITCTVEGVKFVSYGQGFNRRKAEQIAAQSMLKELRSIKK